MNTISMVTLWANNVVLILRDCFRVIVVVRYKEKVWIIVAHNTTNVRKRSSKVVTEDHECLTAL
jgi:hypothetical protein